MNHAWSELGLTIEGVGNRLEEKYAPAVTRTIDGAAKWIEKNKALADSLTEIGIAIAGIFALKPAAWALRLLGLGALTGPEAAAAAVAGGAGAIAGSQNAPILDDYGRQMGTWGGQDQTAPTGAPMGNGRNGPGISVPKAPSNAAATMQRAHDYFRARGLTEEQTAGILANMAAESGFDPTKMGDNGTSYGLFQYHGDRLSGLRNWARTANPSEQQQLDYAWLEMTQGGQQSTYQRLRSVGTPGQAGAIFASGFEVPAGGQGEAFRRGQAADQFMQGHVQVDVHLKGAPPGTTATVTTSGPVSAAPPRVETPMPGVN